jgi:hypothetical protein
MPETSLARVRWLWLLVVLLPLAAAQESTLLRFTATEDGFRVEGYAGLNPTLSLAPGEHVRVILVVERADGANLRFSPPVDAATPCCQRAGETATLEFVVPNESNVEGSYSSEVGSDRLAGRLVIREAYPEIRTLEPENGADAGGNVTMRVLVRHFTLDPYPYSEQNSPGRGHLRYLLDGKPAFGPTDRLSYAFALPEEPGAHLLRAELVGHDGAPISPATYAEAVVHRVRDVVPTFDGGNPTATPPKDAPGFGAATLALAAAVALALLSASPYRRRR